MSIRVDRGAGGIDVVGERSSAKRGGECGVVIRAGRGCLVKEWQRQK